MTLFFPKKLNVQNSLFLKQKLHSDFCHQLILKKDESFKFSKQVQNSMTNNFLNFGGCDMHQFEPTPV